MRICLVTDAWRPQVNGVVRTLETLKGTLSGLGHDVCCLTPDRFRTMRCPSYPEIRLALASPRAVAEAIEAIAPEAIHIATEGPLGQLARAYCRNRSLRFSTSYHTMFPEYVHARWRVPTPWTYGFLRRFHNAAACTMVATRSIEEALRRRGFTQLKRWSRGVDIGLFRPRAKDFLSYPRPVSLYVGRIAVEKNIEAFLRLTLPGTKVIVGDGPQRAQLARRHPDAVFVGVKQGEDLARYYAAADVFVFPSRTDTFGLVLLEALASGVPVAAYPVSGPLDVIDGSAAGALDSDLGRAVARALTISSDLCLAHARRFSWDASAREFLGHLVGLREGAEANPLIRSPCRGKARSP
jgi:glycosyltransferase involved in cell wall biosynthesis